MEEEEKPISPEEIAKRKAELTQYYDEQIPFLTKQRDYEALITELDELRMRREYAKIKLGEMLAPEPEERKLKRQ